MSLRVWLPLDGDLHNQGLSDAIFSKATNVWGAGKIGAQSLLTSTGTGSVMVNELKDKKEFSIAYWVKIDSSLTFSNWQDIWAVDYTNATGTYPIRDEHTSAAGNHQLLMAKETNVGSNTNGYIGMTIGNAPDTWQHIVLVKGLTQTKSYVNGELKLTRNNTDFETSNGKLTGNVRIGAATCGAYLNDFRIYDHCLSAVEVKEIAQGLIVHYKLDNNGCGKPNLALRSNDFSGWSVGSGWQKLEENGSTVYHYERTGATSNTWNRLIPNLHIIPDEHPNGITVSFDFKCDNLAQLNSKIIAALQVYREDNVRVGWREAAWDLTGCTDGQWCRISRTYTQAELKTNNHSSYPNAVIAYTTVSFQLVQNGSIYIKHVKIEDGNQATAYFPASEDFGTTSIIEDSSGYQNHGRAYNNPTISTNTPRYSASTYFNGSGAYIICNSAGKRKDVMTVNLWVYKDTETQVNSLISCSYGTSGGWEIAFNNNHIRYRVIIGTSSRIALGYTAPVELNYGWNMITGTYENRTAKLYINGEFITQHSATTTYNDVIRYVTNNLLIGATGTSDSNVTPTSFFQGNISDVRIYCTSLLDTDIKQLYNVGMKVDKSQNIHAFEFAEQNGATQFKHAGVIETAQVSDDLLFDKKAHIGKKSYPNILENTIDVITTKNSNIKKGTITSISAEQVQALAGKTLRLTYDVCADGDRSSTENGQTAYNYTRYGIHGSMAYTNGSGTTGTAYPFAGFLNYSGPATHAVQTWTVPTGYQTYGSLGFSVQNFDSPASTNSATWFIQNVRLEVVETTSNGFVTGTQLIER